MAVSISLNIPGPTSALEASRHRPFHTLLDCSVSLQNRAPGCELDLESGTWPAMTLELVLLGITLVVKDQNCPSVVLTI